MFDPAEPTFHDHVFGDSPGYGGPAWTPELARAAAYKPSDAPPIQRDTTLLDAGDEFMALASTMARCHGRMVELLAEHGDALAGPDDLSRWVAWAAGMKPSAAKATVRLAAKVPELPQITAALSKGEISFDKATTIARVATPETEETLVEWAKSGLVSQLSSITSGYLKVKSADEADGAHLRRQLSYFFSEDGSFRLRAQMSADQGAIVARALDAASDRLFEEQKTFRDHELSESEVTAQHRDLHDRLRARQADGLVALAETFLDHGLSDDKDRFKVVVHVDRTALQGDPSGTAELEDGVGISHETALRLSCDAKIAALVEDDGIIVNFGRAKRVVSPGLRRLLMARDRHCCFPGCTSRRRLQAHHVQHWTRDHGETEPDNLCMLCPRHHRLVHEGHYTMTFDGKVARFYRPDGSELARVPRWPELSEVERYEWCAREDLDYDAWAHDVEWFDLNEAVAYLLREDPERHPKPDIPASALD